MTELHWAEVDGVPAIWTEGQEPLSAGLLFRSGIVDEQLSTSGQTHLLEHLALSTVSDLLSERSNGFVTGACTGFVVRGSENDVVDFFDHVCLALTTLPRERLDAEKHVLEAEAAARPYSASANLLVWRYGASGWGLTGMPAVGFRPATVEQLQSLANERFTRGNAVLWLSGPPPPELRLRLPEGGKVTLPEPTPVLTFPSWHVDEHCGGIAVATTVPRTPTGTIFRAIAEKRLRAHLRGSLAVSYAPSIGYEPLSADTAHLVLYADSDAERRAELARGFTDTFAHLTDVEDTDVASARDQVLDSMTGAGAPTPDERRLQAVSRAAMDWIYGAEFESIDVLAEKLNSVHAQDVVEFANEVHKGALFALPSADVVEAQMGEMAPVCLAPPVVGYDVASVDAPLCLDKLVVGKPGVSIVAPDGQSRTVRYASLGAALTYDDGAVCLIGSDGASILIEPTLWRNGASVCDDIRRHIPHQLLVDQGARPTEAIPEPETTMGQRLIGHAWSLSGIFIYFASVAAIAVVIYLVTGNVHFSIIVGIVSYFTVRSLWRKRSSANAPESPD